MIIRFGFVVHKILRLDRTHFRIRKFLSSNWSVALGPSEGPILELGVVERGMGNHKIFRRRVLQGL